jgi:hypothetical protein
MMKQGNERIPANQRPPHQAVDKSTKRCEQVWMIAKWVRTTVLLRDHRVQEEQRSARDLAPTAYEKLLEIFGTPAQDEFLMRDIVTPLTNLTQVSLRAAGRAIKQYGPCL